MRKFLLPLIFSCMAAPSLADTVEIDQVELRACFDTIDRIARLGCYDRVLNRPVPAEENTRLPDPEPAPQTVVNVELERLRSFLTSANLTDEGVAVTALNRETRQRLPAGPDGLLAMIDPPPDPESFQNFRLENDIYLGVPAIEALGEAGMLLVSCENNITNLRAVWPDRFEGGLQNARLYFGNSLSDLQRREDVVMRVRSDGHALMSPRGLESIRILQRLVTGERVQISVGDNPDELRSMFFDADALREALPIVARHCSWSVQSFRREF